MNSNKRLMISALYLSLLVFAACAQAGPAADGSFDRTLNVSGPADLDISTGAGYIRVRAGSAGTVRIHALIRARDDMKMRGEEKVRYLESHPPVEQAGNTIRIGRIENRDYSQNVSISYELEVPADSRLRGSTGSGDLTADGLRGPVDANTGSGSLTVRNCAERVRARTGSGEINLTAVKGGAEASTGSGGIKALGVAGAFKGETGSGSISLEQSGPGDVDARTGSGSISLLGVRGALHASTGSGNITASGEPAAGWKLSTSSGDVEIRFNSSAAFDVYAHTSSGSVTVDHPVTIQGKVSPKEIRGRVRAGGPLIEAHTSSGSVRIR